MNITFFKDPPAFRKLQVVFIAILQASFIGYPYTPQLMAGKAIDARL